MIGVNIRVSNKVSCDGGCKSFRCGCFVLLCAVLFGRVVWAPMIFGKVECNEYGRWDWSLVLIFLDLVEGDLSLPKLGEEEC